MDIAFSHNLHYDDTRQELPLHLVQEFVDFSDSFLDIYQDITHLMRQYESSHPWITFQADFRTLPYSTWIRLGEAQSKCEHLATVPLLPDIAEQLHQLYLAKGVVATTAIEGNTLTEEEVLRRLQGKLFLPPSKEYLGQEVDNVIEACNQISQDVLHSRTLTLSTAEIRGYNQLVLRSLPAGEDVRPGQVRTHSVVVGSYRGAPAEDCDYLLERFCQWLNDEIKFPGNDRIVAGILKAIVAHVYFAWIHPFGDGNGRTARLIEFKILLASGVPMAAAHLLSNHYNLTRQECYRRLALTSKRGGSLDDFIWYALQGFVDGLKEQLGYIRQQQIIVHWRDFIYSQFRDLRSPADQRRRRLLLDLTEQAGTGPVTPSQIRRLTPHLAEAYAGKTDKTVQRDLAHLEELKLIVRTRTGVTANLQRVLSRMSPAISDEV